MTCIEIEQILLHCDVDYTHNIISQLHKLLNYIDNLLKGKVSQPPCCLHSAKVMYIYIVDNLQDSSSFFPSGPI